MTKVDELILQPVLSQPQKKCRGPDKVAVADDSMNMTHEGPGVAREQAVTLRRHDDTVTEFTIAASQA